MAGKTQGEMIKELHTVVLGIPNTDEGGLIGDVKEMKVLIQTTNGCVRRNTTRIWFLFGIVVTLGVLFTGEMSGLIHIFGG